MRLRRYEKDRWAVKGAGLRGAPIPVVEEDADKKSDDGDNRRTPDYGDSE